MPSPHRADTCCSQAAGALLPLPTREAKGGRRRANWLAGNKQIILLDHEAACCRRLATSVRTGSPARCAHAFARSLARQRINQTQRGGGGGGGGKKMQRKRDRKEAFRPRPATCCFKSRRVATLFVGQPKTVPTGRASRLELEQKKGGEFACS